MKGKGYISFLFLIVYSVFSAFATSQENGYRKGAAFKTFKVSPSFFIPNTVAGKKGKQYILKNNQNAICFIQTSRGRVVFTSGGAYIGMQSPGEKSIEPEGQTASLREKAQIVKPENILQPCCRQVVVMKCGFGEKSGAKSKTASGFRVDLEEPSVSYVNFLIGKQTEWRRRIPMYRQLVYRNV